MAHQSMTISRLAEAGGVHIETVRYYQRRGLLSEPARPAGGVRRYGAADVGRLQFIRRAQAMGFSLDEVADLLALKGQRACKETQLLTERKLAEVRRRLEGLRQLEAELEHLVDECCQAAMGAPCPTLDLLGQTPSPRPDD